MIVTALANERPRRERASFRTLLNGEPIQISAQSPRGERQRAFPTVLRQFFRSPLSGETNVLVLLAFRPCLTGNRLSRGLCPRFGSCLKL